MSNVCALSFSGYKDFSQGLNLVPMGKDGSPVPVMLWELPNLQPHLLKHREHKQVELLSLPDQSRAIRKRNRHASPKLAEVGARVLCRLLGFQHLADADLAVSPHILHPDARKDVFVLQDYVEGMTVAEGLRSEKTRPRFLEALGKLQNLIPLYLHMVIAGDSDRHNENLILAPDGKLWSLDFELSGGHDFYTYKDYESFSTSPELEAQLAKEPAIPAEVRNSLESFVNNPNRPSEQLFPYYEKKTVQGMRERAAVLLGLGKLIPTKALFPLIRHTFYPNVPQ